MWSISVNLYTECLLSHCAPDYLIALHFACMHELKIYTRWLSGGNSGRPQKTAHASIIVPSAYSTHTFMQGNTHVRKKRIQTKETGLTSYHPLFTVAVFFSSICVSLSLFLSSSRSRPRPLSLYLPLRISCSLFASVCLFVSQFSAAMYAWSQE